MATPAIMPPFSAMQRKHYRLSSGPCALIRPIGATVFFLSSADLPKCCWERTEVAIGLSAAKVAGAQPQLWCRPAVSDGGAVADGTQKRGGARCDSQWSASSIRHRARTTLSSSGCRAPPVPVIAPRSIRCSRKFAGSASAAERHAVAPPAVGVRTGRKGGSSLYGCAGGTHGSERAVRGRLRHRPPPVRRRRAPGSTPPQSRSGARHGCRARQNCGRRQ